MQVTGFFGVDGWGCSCNFMAPFTKLSHEEPFAVPPSMAQLLDSYQSQILQYKCYEFSFTFECLHQQPPHDPPNQRSVGRRHLHLLMKTKAEMTSTLSVDLRGQRKMA